LLKSESFIHCGMIVAPGICPDTVRRFVRYSRTLWFLADGTDLFVQYRAGRIEPPSVICLERIRGFSGIQTTANGIRIGAGTCLTELVENSLIKDRLGVLHQACESLRSPLIRNMATLGGNICTASPAGDTLPALYVLGACLELVSPEGSRTIPIRDFIKGPGQTGLKRQELLWGMIIPVPEGYGIHHFEKVGQRRALAIAIASLAALVKLEADVVQDIRLAWGSVGPVIIQNREIEKALIGKPLSLTDLEKAAEMVRQAVSPISDIRASENYRRTVSGNLLLRLSRIRAALPDP
jgi:xanthine dehydrogenase FAD-binding subunit